MLTPPDDLKRELQESLPVTPADAGTIAEPAQIAEPSADLEKAAEEAVGAPPDKQPNVSLPPTTPAAEQSIGSEQAASISLAEEAPAAASIDERMLERTSERTSEEEPAGEDPAEEPAEVPAPVVSDEAEPGWLTAAADALAAPPPVTGSGERLWALVVGADQDQGHERPEQLVGNRAHAPGAPTPGASTPGAPTPAKPAPPPAAASSRELPPPPPPLATLASAPPSGDAASACSSANLPATASSQVALVTTAAAVAAAANAATAAVAAAQDGSSYAASEPSEKSAGASAPSEDPFAFAAWDSAPPIEKTDWCALALAPTLFITLARTPALALVFPSLSPSPPWPSSPSVASPPSPHPHPHLDSHPGAHSMRKLWHPRCHR